MLELAHDYMRGSSVARVALRNFDGSIIVFNGPVISVQDGATCFVEVAYEN